MVDKVEVSEEELEAFMGNPLVKFSDMNIEMSVEAKEIIRSEIDKEIKKTRKRKGKKINLQNPAKSIKANMDKKFGKYWHVCIGEGFSFDVVHQKKHGLLLYYGKLGVLLFKS
eukprot:g2314.t1